MKGGHTGPPLQCHFDPTIRSFVVSNYVLYYRNGANGIEVARVLHGRRDTESFFRR
jgi:plasmid stabilization system protein ParE